MFDAFTILISPTKFQFSLNIASESAVRSSLLNTNVQIVRHCVVCFEIQSITDMCAIYGRSDRYANISHTFFYHNYQSGKFASVTLFINGLDHLHNPYFQYTDIVSPLFNAPNLFTVQHFWKISELWRATKYAKLITLTTASLS